MAHYFYIIKRNLFQIILLISIFILSLENLFGIDQANYLDELLAIPAFISLLFFMFDKSKQQWLYPLITLMLLLIIGGVSSLVNFENIGFTNMIVDAFIFLKPFIYLFLGIFIPSRYNIKNKWLISFSKLMIILMAICFIIQIIVTGDTKFVFLSGGLFGGWVANWLILFTVLITLKYDKYNFVYCIISSILIYFADSGLGMLGVFLCLYFLFITRKIKINFLLLILFAAVVLFISYDEIVGYLFNPDAPRYILFKYGFITALTYFPFGSGFATYGSVMAAQNYSYLYYMYGFENIYGLGPEPNNFFLFDAYYPMIIGQFGILGSIIFCVMFIMIFIYILKSIRSRHKNAALTLFIYFSVMLLGFNAGSGTSCAFLLVLGLIINKLTTAKYEEQLILNEDCHSNQLRI